MKYMLLLWEPDTEWDTVPEPQLRAALDAHEEFIAYLDEHGIEHTGGALRPSTTATTMRPDGADVLVTDGPYVELVEHLGGYYVVEARDLDHALQIARRCPMGSGTEVRPLWG